MRLALSALLLSALVVAGCVQPPAQSPGAVSVPEQHRALLALLKADPAPALDGARVAAWLQSFVEAHHPRLTGTPEEKATADDIAAQLSKLGYTVERKKWGANGLPSADGPIQAIVAVKKGTSMADHLLIAGAHYDTAQVGTADITPGALPVTPPVGTPPLYATYDNGSGTAMVMELARLLAMANNTHTFEFVLFNGEEQGVLGSSALAKELQAKGAKVDAYLGFDMVGINYPSPAGCLCIYAGKRAAADINPVQETVAFDLLGYPRGNGTVQVFDNHDRRNSDEASFATAGFPTMRWAGLALAGNYWAYHKMNDTMDTIVKQAGSAELFNKGLESTSATAYYTMLAMDHRT